MFSFSFRIFLIHYFFQMGTKDQSDALERAIDQMSRKTRDLRRQLRKAVVDHISDRYNTKNITYLTHSSLT